MPKPMDVEYAINTSYATAIVLSTTIIQLSTSVTSRVGLMWLSVLTLVVGLTHGLAFRTSGWASKG